MGKPHMELRRFTCSCNSSILIWLVGAMVLAANASAQTPGIDYEKVLLPTVLAQQQPGALGSLWVTRVTVTNSGQQPVDAWPFSVSPFGVDPGSLGGLLPVNTTLEPLTNVDRQGERGTFFFMDRRFVRNVQISLRAQDISRESLAWGTAIPVPREEAFTSGTLTLIDVPTDARFRQTLRVYSLDSSRPSTVRISLFGVTLNTFSTLPQPDVFLGSQDSALTDHRTWLPVYTLAIPGFLEISGVNTIAPTTGYDLVRIDVRPLDGSSIWAFVTITNDETQHVTVIAPTP